MLRISDINERTGPYWDAYQDERAREGILDNPDYVPEWFLFRMAMRRFAAARCAVEALLDTLNREVFNLDNEQDRALVDARAALHTLENFMRFGSNRIGQRELVTAAMLGAEEIQAEQERRGALDTAAREFVERTAGQPYQFGGVSEGYDGSAVADRAMQGIELKRRPLREAIAYALGLPPDTDESALIVEVATLKAAQALGVRVHRVRPDTEPDYQRGVSGEDQS